MLLRTAGILTMSSLQTEVASTEPESKIPAPMLVLVGTEILTEGEVLSASCAAKARQEYRGV